MKSILTTLPGRDTVNVYRFRKDLFMSTPANTLQRFHQFVGEQLASTIDASMSPEQALALWREREESLAALQEGLADVQAGRTKSLEEFDRDFRARHGIEGAA